MLCVILGFCDDVMMMVCGVDVVCGRVVWDVCVVGKIIVDVVMGDG